MSRRYTLCGINNFPAARSMFLQSTWTSPETAPRSSLSMKSRCMTMAKSGPRKSISYRIGWRKSFLPSLKSSAKTRLFSGRLLRINLACPGCRRPPSKACHALPMSLAYRAARVPLGVHGEEVGTWDCGITSSLHRLSESLLMI